MFCLEVDIFVTIKVINTQAVLQEWSLGKKEVRFGEKGLEKDIANANGVR